MSDKYRHFALLFSDYRDQAATRAIGGDPAKNGSPLSLVWRAFVQNIEEYVGVGLRGDGLPHAKLVVEATQTEQAV